VCGDRQRVYHTNCLFTEKPCIPWNIVRGEQSVWHLLVHRAVWSTTSGSISILHLKVRLACFWARIDGRSSHSQRDPIQTRVFKLYHAGSLKLNVLITELSRLLYRIFDAKQMSYRPIIKVHVVAIVHLYHSLQFCSESRYPNHSVLEQRRNHWPTNL